MIGARRGSSLAVGYGDGEMYIGSDALALAPFTKRVSYLKTATGSSCAAMAPGLPGHHRGQARDARPGLRAPDRQRQPPPLHAQGDPRAAGGDRRHAAELRRSGDAHGRCCRTCRSTGSQGAEAPSSPAARLLRWLVAKYWFEQIARLPVEIDIAPSSATAHRRCPRAASALYISQSGETADTLAALRYAKAAEADVLSVVNVPESTIARESRRRAARPWPGPRSASPRPRPHHAADRAGRGNRRRRARAARSTRGRRGALLARR
jgi:glucosamine--fructose-6-phosphate aminotransferase (isomerizing)